LRGKAGSAGDARTRQITEMDPTTALSRNRVLIQNHNYSEAALSPQEDLK
jgi:hypothetical protein